MNILSYGDFIKDGNYKVLSRFNKAVNFISGSSIVSLVCNDIGPGPINIVIDELHSYEFDTLRIIQDEILLNNTKINRNHIKKYDSSIAINEFERESYEHNLKVFENFLIDLSPQKSLTFLLDEKRKNYFKTSFEREFIKRTEQGIDNLFNSKFKDGVELIKGCGFGLTPSGDDFITGLLIALNVRYEILGDQCSELIDTIYSFALGDNPLTNVYMECAKNGMLFERVKNLVNTLFWKSDKEVEGLTRQLTLIGETSGADTGVGLLFGLKMREKW